MSLAMFARRPTAVSPAAMRAAERSAAARAAVTAAMVAYENIYARRKAGEASDADVAAARAALDGAQSRAARTNPPSGSAVVAPRATARAADKLVGVVADGDDAFAAERGDAGALGALVFGREESDPDVDTRFDGVLVSD